MNLRSNVYETTTISTIINLIYTQRQQQKCTTYEPTSMLHTTRVQISEIRILRFDYKYIIYMCIHVYNNKSMVHLLYAPKNPTAKQTDSIRCSAAIPQCWRSESLWMRSLKATRWWPHRQRIAASPARFAASDGTDPANRITRFNYDNYEYENGLTW